MMRVEFKNNIVMYTEDGLPDWGSDKVQTLFYISDICLEDQNIEIQQKLLSKKQINKYMSRNQLEMRCPSGIWRNVLNCPTKIVSAGINKLAYHLFRKFRKFRKTRKN